MKGIAMMLFGIAMILCAICSALLFLAGGETIFAVILGIFAFVGFFAVLCGLAQVYERRKKKDNGKATETLIEEQINKENVNK